MAESEREPRIEESLTRKSRIRPAPRAPASRLRRARGLPATLGGATLGFLTFLYFWFKLAVDYDSLGFLLRFVSVMVLVAAGLVLIAKVILPRAKDRRRAKRRIRRVDRRAWNALAAEHGLRPPRDRRPRVKGTIDGVPVGMSYEQVGGARTEGRARAAAAFPARLRINPRGAEYGRSRLVPTGDPEFDRAFRVDCEDPDLVARVVEPDLRRTIRELGDVEIEIEGTTVRARTPRCLEVRADLDDLLQILLRLARGPTSPSSPSGT